MQELKTNTAVLVTVGPFYDKGTGVDIETGLTITNEKITLTADTDAGSAPTNILDNATGSTTGDNALNYISGNDAGMMQLALTAANVNRLGRMRLSITDAANHCPVFHEFEVVSAAYWDWKYGTTNPTVLLSSGTGTGQLSITSGVVSASVASIANDAITAASIATGAIDVNAIATDAITAATVKADAVTKIQAGLATPTNITAGTITTATNLTNLPAVPNNWLTAAGINADAITAAKLHADVTTELQAGLATSAEVTAVSNKIGTPLDLGNGTATVAGNLSDIDTETDLILAAVNGIGTSGGAAINTDAAGDNASAGIPGVTEGTTKIGTQAAGSTYAYTSFVDLSRHQIDAAANALSWVYQFLTGGGTTPVGVTWTGYQTVNGSSSSVAAWNHASGAWEVIGTITGQNGTTNVVKNFVLYPRHAGTSEAELGKVYLRFLRVSGSSISILTDQVYVTYAVTSRTAGYANGSIWVRPTATGGVAGTEPFVNGTADNPCPWADALTLSAALGMTRFEIAAGTTVTLGADLKNASLDGHGWFLDLNGKDISYTRIEGCEGIVGAGLAADHEAFIYNSQISDTGVTLGEVDIHDTHITGVVTLSAEKPYLIEHCVGVPAGGVPTLAFGATADARAVVVAGFGGQLLVTGMKAGNVLILDGDCDLTLDNSNTAGTVYLSGNIRLTYNGTGQTVYDTSRWGEDQSISSVTGDTKQTADVAALIATVGVAGAGLTGTGIPAATVTALGTGSGLTALATQASVNTLDDFVDTEVNAIKAVTDKLDTGLVLDGSVYQFTANALELAPTGAGGGLDAAQTRAALGMASANLDTQLAALPTDADVNAACDTAIADAALATAANLATVDGVVDSILTESQSHPTLAEIEATTVLAKVGSNMGTVASVTGAVGSVTAPVTAGTVSDKTGYSLSSAGVTAIWAEVVEGTITAVQAVRGILATAIGKLSGAATTTITIRDASDTKARVTATVDADGNRTAITKDLT